MGKRKLKEKKERQKMKKYKCSRCRNPKSCILILEESEESKLLTPTYCPLAEVLASWREYD